MLHSYREVCILYITATCNLKCRYCYIDKAPILKQIDDKLKNSYEGDYYYNFIHKVFDDKESMHSMQFWGGEPSFGLPRTLDLMRRIIPEYPNLNHFMMSSNLTTPHFVEDLFAFLNMLGEFPNRVFTFELQISLDGPEYLTDYNRGHGTTKKLRANFERLVNEADERFRSLPNVALAAHFKPTLASDTVAMLQTEEKVIEYYQYFEEYKDYFYNHVKSAPFFLELCVPNTAAPSPVTTQGGKEFANFCKICNHLDELNRIVKDPFFKYFSVTVPYANGQRVCGDYCLDNGCLTCGTGRSVVGLLPDDLISCCHMGFAELLGDYRKHGNENAEKLDSNINFKLFETNGDGSRDVVMPWVEYEQFERQMEGFNLEATFSVTELASLITVYARAGQIEEKYKHTPDAIDAAHFIQRHTAGCIRDNLGTTGTKFLPDIGYIKLLLNGAKEYIEREDTYFRN